MSPWQVLDIQFDPEKGRIDFKVGFSSGTKFSCPECGEEEQGVHDTRARTWRASELLSVSSLYPCRSAPCPLRSVRQNQTGARAMGSSWQRLQSPDGGSACRAGKTDARSCRGPVDGPA